MQGYCHFMVAFLVANTLLLLIPRLHQSFHYAKVDIDRRYDPISYSMVLYYDPSLNPFLSGGLPETSNFKSTASIRTEQPEM